MESEARLFKGGCSSLIRLSQTLTVYGVDIYVTWPPAFTGSSISRSWTSDPLYVNLSGTPHPNTRIHLALDGFVTAAHYTHSADIYLHGVGYVYRPQQHVIFTVI